MECHETIHQNANTTQPNIASGINRPALLRQSLSIPNAPKRKCHFDEIFVTGCTRSCLNDNFWCRQWWKFRQNYSNSVSVRDIIHSENVQFTRILQTYSIDTTTITPICIGQIMQLLQCHWGKPKRYTENKRSSFWQLCCHWWHRKLS